MKSIMYGEACSNVPIYKSRSENRLIFKYMANKLDTIEDAINDIKKGKLVIVVDDEDRENEGDFITAARNITLEIVNFMLKHGRGVLCAPIEESRCHDLGLDMMVTETHLYIKPHLLFL